MAPPSLVFGQRIYENLKPGDKQPFFNWLVAVVTLTLYCGWMNFFVVLIVGCLFSTVCRYVVLALLSTLLLPAAPVLWPAFNRLFIFRTWREYFRYSYVFEEPLEHDKKYILVEFPHGAFPIAQITAGTLVQTMFPETPVYSIAASAVFYIPLWRHIIAWIGSVPATRDMFKQQLKKGSVAVVVGGIAEMFMMDKEKERVKLRGRKGFARVALEEDVDGIVPVYYFGQSQLLNFGPAWLSSLSRKIRVSLALYLYGRWGLPLPRNMPIFLAHGKPIPVPKGVRRSDENFEAVADELVGKTSAALQEMYDKYKEEYGWKDRPLSIE